MAELKIVHGEADAGSDLVGHDVVEQAVGGKRAVVFNVAAHLIVLITQAGGEEFRFRIQQQPRRFGRGGANHNHARGYFLVRARARALE